MEITKTIMEAPSKSEALYVDQKYTVTATLCDRFENPLDRGGHKVLTYLEHEKQGLHDSTALNVANHRVTVEDKHDGTYAVSIELLSAGGHLNYFPVVTYLHFDIDTKAGPKDEDPNIAKQSKLAPVKLVFNKREDDAAPPRLLRRRTSSAGLMMSPAPAPAPLPHAQKTVPTGIGKEPRLQGAVSSVGSATSSSGGQHGTGDAKASGSQRSKGSN